MAIRFKEVEVRPGNLCEAHRDVVQKPQKSQNGRQLREVAKSLTEGLEVFDGHKLGLSS
jgi:hypothetical protein